MRYVSETFKEKQNQVIRPALKLYFEVGTDVANTYLKPSSQAKLGLDETVAPVIYPKFCTNEYHYAVVGDGVGVDDPNRMCAPVDDSGFATPEHTVPFGVAYPADTNEEVLLGSNTYYQNYIGITTPITLSFKGGLIPEQIRVEKYDNATSTWSTEETIDNSELNDEITIQFGQSTPGAWRRFWLLNTQKGGRYQFNWLRVDVSMRENTTWGERPPVVFKNSYISAVSVDEETDLTSQTLPSYEMTVECLDPDGTYNPDSDYWKPNHQFANGAVCYFKIGYEADGGIEYLPFMYGNLVERPKYSKNKITFKVAVAWTSSFSFNSLPNNNRVVGEGTYNRKYKTDILPQTFDSYDVFHGFADEWGSECNYYGTIESNQTRQLIANALGCFITSGFNTYSLFNTNDIQYRSADDYLTRQEQIQNTFENKPKVRSISLSRKEYLVSENTTDAEAAERVTMTQIGTRYYAYVKFLISEFAVSRMKLIDAQSSVSGATITVEGGNTPTVTERITPDGFSEITATFYSNVATTIKPKVRFNMVDNEQFDETETVDTSSTEVYYNDNMLITNMHNSAKAKSVARLMSDMSEWYEADVLQDLRYELGDIIRLETQKNVFKTCIITGLKFKFPGSTGHVTCRKLFSIADSDYALSDVDNCFIAKDGIIPSLKINNTENGFCVVGKLIFNNITPIFIILGAESITSSGTVTTVTVTDANLHEWKAYSLIASDLNYDFTPVELGDYDSSKVVSTAAYGAITLIMKLYEEQNMTSPVDYSSEFTVT